MSRPAVAFVAAALVACATTSPVLPECPGALVDLSQAEGDFLLRQRLRVQAEGIDALLTLAVQKRGPQLVLVAFDPVGAVAFRVTQSGDEIHTERRLPRSVQPVPPVNALRDLHRSLFLRLDPPAGGEGIVEGEVEGTRIAEGWHGGRLVWRLFEPLAGSAGGAVELAFGEGSVEIDNPGCGYRATLVDLALEPLP